MEQCSSFILTYKSEGATTPVILRYLTLHYSHFTMAGGGGVVPGKASACLQELGSMGHNYYDLEGVGPATTAVSFIWGQAAA